MNSTTYFFFFKRKYKYMYSANLFIVACFLATNMAIILLNTFPSTSDIHTYNYSFGIFFSSGVISSRLGWPLIRETVTDQYNSGKGSLIACSETEILPTKS